MEDVELADLRRTTWLKAAENGTQRFEGDYRP
jgi:hypothetical protein